MKATCIRLIPALFFSLRTIAQDIPPVVQQQIENKAAVTQNETDKDDAGYFQDLLYFKEHPLNINSAKAEELQALQLLTNIQISNLISYRNLLGKFVDLHELQSVPGLDLFTISNLIPYVYAGPSTSAGDNLRAALRGGDHSLTFLMGRVLERSRGYDTATKNHYQGSPEHITINYRYRKGTGMQYGVLADKDAGEPLFRSGQKQGFDFYSFHFFMRSQAMIKAFAIGDYTVSIGEGLLQWQSYALNKSAELTSIKKQGPVLMPHNGPGEFNFNRGVAVSFGSDKLLETCFASYRRYSSSSVLDSAERFPGFNSSGYHRTPGEMANRNNIGNLSFGNSLTYSFGSTRLSANLVYHSLSRSLNKNPAPYNYFAPRGSVFFNQSLSFSTTIRNVYMFGELATDKFLHPAALAGALASIDPKLDVGIVLRNMGMKYQALFASSFGENYNTQNERGLYLNICLRPTSRIVVNTYSDFFHFPWLRYRVNAPTNGYDYLVQVKYAPSAMQEIGLIYQDKAKPVDPAAGVTTVNAPQDEDRKLLRLTVRAEGSKRLAWAGKVYLLRYRQGNSAPEQGFLGSMETQYGRGKFRLHAGLQYFETDSYNSRIYVFENGLSSSFSTTAYYGSGLSFFVNARWHAANRIIFDLLLGRKFYYNKSVIGSGLDAIDGGAKTTVSFLVTKSF